ncbi:hypothetical protein HDU91_005942 [Kappamyces sp. JEL0680]|nr:hypothetical protein HDU91_005942 [Kappamyces sp. JEL0680]
MPIMMSERYKRTHRYTLAQLTQSQGGAGNGEGNSYADDSFDSLGLQKRGQESSDSHLSSTQADFSKKDTGTTQTALGTNLDEKRAGREDPAALVMELYEPFPLKATSSFSPQKVSPAQLQKMDPRLRAKYLAYEKPTGVLQTQISQSEHRSRKWLTEEHKRMQGEAEEARRKWDLLHRAIEDPEKKSVGESLAAEAKSRIRKKKQREYELQHLVEGQSNSIDAIQLKEFLMPTKKMPSSDSIFTSRERARVEELLSMNFKIE